jgi:hypothetical protein
VQYSFEVRFRTPRHVADKIEEVFDATPLKRPLLLYRPEGMNSHDGWLAVKSCGYADHHEAEASAVRLQEGLLIVAAKQKIGVELYLGGAVKAIHVWPQGSLLEVRDLGLPLPTSIKIDELKDMLVLGAASDASLTPNQRVAAQLLNDSFFFFRMSSEASFLLRVSAVEALCPQAEQTDAFRATVDSVMASIPKEAANSDRKQIKDALDRLAARQSVRSAYKSKIKQLIGNDKAKEFEALYGQRSDFLHDGKGRGTLGDAADAALEIGLELLFADIAQSAGACGLSACAGGLGGLEPS